MSIFADFLKINCTNDAKGFVKNEEFYLGISTTCSNPRLNVNKYLQVWNIYIYIGWGSLGSIVGGQAARTRVILILRECVWNAPAVLLVLPAFDDTGSLGSPPHQVVYPLG